MSEETRADIKKSVQQQFEQAAASYRVSPVHVQGPDLAWMVEAAALQGQERVLDAGCGAGHAALAFAPHVGQVVALDFSPAMLAQTQDLARERGITNLETRLGDVEALPFPDGSFHCVISRYSAHHWPNPRRALAEFARVLLPGGRFILSDTVSFPEPALDTFLNGVELLRDVSHVRDHTPAQWLAMMEEAGLPGELLRRWEIPLRFEPWVARQSTPEPAVAGLRWLFAHGPEEARAALRIQEDGQFVLLGGLFRGAKG